MYLAHHVLKRVEIYIIMVITTVNVILNIAKR